MNDLYKYLMDPPLLWQMDLHERFLLHSIVSCLHHRPDPLAVEIGSYYGGCLAYLNKRFHKVISVDLDHAFLNKEDPLFKDVLWETGASQTKLPYVIDILNAPTVPPCTFFLVDADHEYQAVLSDLYAIYRYKPKAPGFILVHDSAYLPSQRAILRFQEESHWKVHPHFCPGNGIGGFALIEMVP